MRKLIAFIAFFAMLLPAVQACSICGCGGGNFYMGLLPDFKNRFIGIRYRYYQYHTQVANDHTQFSHNYYHSAEIWSGWNIGKRWQLLAFIPYYMTRQVDDDGRTNKNGLGDISLLVNYQLIGQSRNKSKNPGKEQELWLGGGLKLPTGTFRVNVNDPNTTIADINAQIGTGSVDFLFSASHHIPLNQMGVNTIFNYSLRTANSSQYRFGNRLEASTAAYYRFRVLGLSMAPNLGFSYVNTSPNYLKNQQIDLTGGYAWSALAGLECNINRLAFGFNLQAPMAQQYAGGQTKMQVGAMVHLTMIF